MISAETVRELLGPENRALSRGPSLRFGRRGALAVDLARGAWFDHSSGAGGGVLDLVLRERGGTKGEAADWLKARGVALPSGVARPDPTGRKSARPRLAAPARLAPADIEGEARNRQARAAALWREATDPRGGAVEHYLNGRGLSLPSDPAGVIRFHPAAPFGCERLPVMLALVRSIETGAPVAVHRTALTLRGERALGRDGEKLGKLCLGPVAGGAIFLAPDDAVEAALAVAEGVETALAHMARAPHWPTWAAISAGGIRAFRVLSGVEVLRVVADNDPAGLSAAEAVAARWQAAGRWVEIVTPRADGADLADLVERVR